MLFVDSLHVQTNAFSSRYCSVGRSALHMACTGPTMSPSEDKYLLQGQTAVGKPTENFGWGA
ncbi:hypothetical protein DPMN_129623 [Dreissena polymorpha]|uniref:Uncharacterized protein n=1 Tax=Dreissena polymorpha TaxID=45954 RepID=A0A9D4H587_DREPO|nr:hypothetical protein DPMN_129623 [Dreissena polymorpha]